MHMTTPMLGGYNHVRFSKRGAVNRFCVTLQSLKITVLHTHIVICV